MCKFIIVNNGELEIGRLKEFIEYFKDISYIEYAYSVTSMHLKSCLCPIDIKKTFYVNDIDYIDDGMNYIVKRNKPPLE